MEVGDLVQYVGDDEGISGLVKEKISQRVVVVLWRDKVVLTEYIEDLQAARGTS